MPWDAPLVAFVAAALVVLVIPGPGVLYVVARSIGLVYLGVRTLVDTSLSESINEVAPRSLGRLFGDGFVVSALNPKIAVFFLAFLPQFAGPMGGPVPVKILGLGVLYCALALGTDSAYALLASKLRGRFGARFGQSRWPRYASGTVYIGLGVGTALADQH